MNIFRRTTYIFIQITSDSIIIAYGKKWGKNIHLNLITSHAFNNQEITKSTIANPTKIVSLIHQEIDKYRIKKGVIIASIPSLREVTMPAILQTALVLSKCNIPVIHLTNQSIMTLDTKKIPFSLLKKENNLLNYMLPKRYQTAHWWFAGTAAGFCLIAVISFGAYRFYTHQKKELEHAFCAVSYKTKNCDINDLSKKTLHLEKESETIKHTLSLLKQSSKSPSQLDMLIAIAQATPSNSWLESLSITHTTSQKTDSVCLVDMTGCTSSPQEISDIIHHLSQGYAHNSLSLKKIQQQGHNKHDEPLYVFVIKGELGKRKN